MKQKGQKEKQKKRKKKHLPYRPRESVNTRNMNASRLLFARNLLIALYARMAAIAYMIKDVISKGWRAEER